MFFQSMSRWLPAILFSCAPALFAGDVTGDWSGQLTAEADHRPIAFELHQTGDRVAGIVSFRGGLPVEGVVDGNKLVLDGKATNSRTVHFELALNGNRLEGSFVMTRDERKDTASVKVSKVNNPASQAGLAGKWVATIEISFNGETVRPVFTMSFEQEGSVIKGDMTDNDADKTYKFTSVSMHGNNLVMTLDDKGDTGRFDLVLDGDKITGTLIVTDGGKNTTGKFTAVRQI